MLPCPKSDRALPHGCTGVTSDSRRVRPGDIFVAIQGTKSDGHLFLEEAVKNGAAYLYVERPPNQAAVPVRVVPSTRRAYAELVAAFHGFPAEKLSCVGVTGTNGKTTTSTLLQWILNARERRAGLIGTVVVDTLRQTADAALTTPDPVGMQSALAEMVRAKADTAVLEVSSHGIAQGRIAGIPFQTAVFTNLSQDHMDYHTSAEEYLKTKARLFADLPSHGAAVVNADDAAAPEICSSTHALIYTYGLHQGTDRCPVDLRAVAVRPTHRGTTLQLETSLRLRRRALQAAERRRPGAPMDADKFNLRELHVPLRGLHNAENALAAAAAALSLGVQAPVIQEAVRSFPGVWRRQQELPLDRLVIDDACHNPASYEALFHTVDALPASHVRMVSAIRGSRGKEINAEIARSIANWMAGKTHVELWVTDCSDVAGSADRVRPDERRAYLRELQRRGIPYTFISMLEPCLQALAERLKKDDVALLTGAHAMDHAGRRFTEIWNNASRSEVRPERLWV